MRPEISQERMNECIEYVKTLKRVSTGDLQRKLKIGYYAASSMIDNMEKDKVITKENGSIYREVL